MSRVTPPPPSIQTQDAFFPLVKEHVIAQTGLSYYADKDNDLARCLAPHMAARHLSDCGSYLGLLRDPVSGAEELDELIKDLTIGETFFFRHAELFEALRSTVLPSLIARNRAHRRLRIWSAGCATGAEPYSLAILLYRDLAELAAGWDITIIGTDINREFLARAVEGVYEDWALRSTPEEMRRACFNQTGQSWALQPRFKRGVSFQYHNLVTHPFPSLVNNLFAFDLILCRNVLIYFNQDLARRVIGGFYHCLVDGGWLLVGHAEPSVPLFQAYRTVNSSVGAVLYQKVVEPHAPPALFQASAVLPGFMPVSSVAECAGSAAFAPVFDVLADPQTMHVEEPGEPPAPAVHDRPAELAAVRALADQGAWEQALEGCRKLLTLNNLNPLVHFYAGLILEQAGRHAEAEQSLRRALYLNRGFVLAHYYLGLLLQKDRRSDQAARSFRNVLALLDRLDPNHVFEDGDGITAAELAKVTRMQLALLEAT